MIISQQFTFIACIVFLFASSVGSFLNVCIYRIPNNLSIVSPGSHCPSCNTPIPFYLNVPVFAYLFLKGRCKFCKTKIPVRYVLIECLTGLMGVITFAKFGLTLPMIFWFVFICVLITISFIDFDHQIIPDRISLPGIVIFSSSFFFIPDMTIKKVAFGILVGGGSLLLVAVVYYLIRRQEGMGGGDIKLLAMIGAATGIKGVIFTIFIGSFVGTIVGIILIMAQRGSDLKLKIPFGPYLSLGAVLYVFWGNPLIYWYLSLLSG